MATAPAARRDLFGQVAAWTTRVSGGKWAFLIAFGTVVVWAVSGPFFKFSALWQLVINTGTSIATFLMVFLIQNAQNRESKAVHLKLDELIRSIRDAKNEMIDIESLDEKQLDRLAARYSKFAKREHANLESKLDSVESNVGAVEGEVERLEGEVEEVEHRVGRVEEQVLPKG